MLFRKRKSMQEKLDQYLEKKGVFIAYPNINPDDPSYAMIRMGGFGASDAAALLGVSKYGSKAELLKDKLENNTHPEINDIPAVRKGRDCEHIFIGYAEKYFENAVIKPTHMYGYKLKDGRDTGLRVNFDGVMQVARKEYLPVEIKLCTYYGRKNYDWSKALGKENCPQTRHILTHNIERDAEFYGIPVNYYCQLQQQMLFLDANCGYLAVMDDHNWEMYYYLIHKDEWFWEVLKQTALVETTVLHMKRGKLNDRKPSDK